MNKIKCYKVIDLIDEDIIKEADIKEVPLSAPGNDKGITVSGVEVYHRPAWKKFLAAASALVLAAGAISGGAFLMKNFMTKPADVFDDSDQNIIITEQNSVETNSEEVVPTKETTEVDENKAADIEYSDLQLHTTPYFTDSKDDADSLRNEHLFKIQWEDRHKYRVDTECYADLLLSDEYDINSLEAKSYIYHLMLNSFLYYDSAKGTVIKKQPVYGLGSSQLDFQVDVAAQESYTSLKSDIKETKWELYVYDDKHIDVVYPDNTYEENGYCKQPYVMIPEDNYRFINTSPPDYGASSYIYNGFFGIACNELMPDQLASSLLSNFDNWHINAISEQIGRPVAEISGVCDNGNDFTVTVDIYTGILLAFTESCNGEYIEINEMTSLELDIPIERVEFDPSGFTKRAYK